MEIFLCCVVLFYLLSLISQKSDGFSVTSKQRRVCIIGAGYSGLTTARHMKKYGLNFTVFEATRHIGGTWRFDTHVGTDEDGLPLFTSMYKDLRTNTPQQTMEYGGYPLPNHTRSFISGPCFYKYLKSFATHFDLLKYIQLRSLVTLVKWKKDHWIMTYYKTDIKRKYTETCDFVVVASGLYSKPHLPKFEGQENFKGKIIHSHDFKEREPFKNQRVLVVGAGPSGMDLAAILSSVASKLVHSHHATFNYDNFPKNVIRKPDIESFTFNGVIFQDGSFEDIDIVILSTGFEYDHEFLDKSSELALSPKFLMPLYQQAVNIKRPSMVFVGKLRTIVIRIYDVQAEYAAALAANKFKLPPQDVMLKTWTSYMYSMMANGTNILRMNVFSDRYDVNEYLKTICQEAGIIAPPAVLDQIKTTSANYRLQDWQRFRDFDYEIVDDQNFIRKYNPRIDVCPFGN